MAIASLKWGGDEEVTNKSELHEDLAAGLFLLPITLPIPPDLTDIACSEDWGRKKVLK